MLHKIYIANKKYMYLCKSIQVPKNILTTYICFCKGDIVKMGTESRKKR